MIFMNIHDIQVGMIPRCAQAYYDEWYEMYRLVIDLYEELQVTGYFHPPKDPGMDGFEWSGQGQEMVEAILVLCSRAKFAGLYSARRMQDE